LTTQNPLQRWGLAVALRRGMNKAAVAAARKLTVAVWHVLQEHWNKAVDENSTLPSKLMKLATELGLPTLKELGYASNVAFREQKLEVLRTHPSDGETRFPKPLLRGNICSAPKPPKNKPKRQKH
jgi:hypothetical protein